jgi:hypothetical protein
VKDRIRELPGRRWDPTRSLWLLPYGQWYNLMDLILEFRDDMEELIIEGVPPGYEIPPAVEELQEQLAEHFCDYDY